MLNWILVIWGQFSLWVANQPTFVQVAFGVALFYAALQILKMLSKLIVFLFSPLVATPRRFTKQKDLRPKLSRQKAAPPDDDSPPFVFR